MTTDPALGDYLGGKGIHTPPNLALYAHSWNNPATFLDPDGREPEPVNPSPPGFFRSMWNSVSSWWNTPVTKGNVVREMVPSSCPICIAHPELAMPYDYQLAEYIDRPLTKGDIVAGVLDIAGIATMGVGTRVNATARVVWALPWTERGKRIESILARTDYRHWGRVGDLDRGFFPAVDFVKDTTVVSLKSVDTRLPSWLATTRRNIRELSQKWESIEIGGVPATRVLDVRVPLGHLPTETQIQQLVQYGQRHGITVMVREFR
jgi:hypothetical protein